MSSQLVYHLCFCCWLLSFLPAAVPRFCDRNHDVANMLVDSAVAFANEKIVRVAVNAILVSLRWDARWWMAGCDW